MSEDRHSFAFESGYSAHRKGYSKEECPFLSTEDGFSFWQRGWAQARHADRDEDFHDVKRSQGNRSAKLKA